MIYFKIYEKKYDFILKFLLQRFTLDYLNLIGVKTFTTQEFLDNELKFQTKISDAVIKLNNYLIHLEFQNKYYNKYYKDIPKRILEYAVRLESKYNLPVSSYLILLKEPSRKNLPVPSKYEWENEKGEKILSFRYKVINIWELERDKWENYDGLIPLLPLMKGDEKIEEYMPRYKEKIKQLNISKDDKANIGTCLAIISGIKYNLEEIRKIWGDIMIVSPLYKEILDKGKIEGKIEGLKESILTMVELEFNKVPQNIKKKIEEINSIDKLRIILKTLKNIHTIEELDKFLI